jgi:NaMN:DMB phosphoribosyltransferase
MIRAARGLLLLLSGLVVMVTIVVLHRMDGQPGKFSLAGNHF